MAEIFLSYLVLYGINSNIITGSGAGALLFQREKMYNSFRYLNSLFLIFGITICGIVSYLLNEFIFIPYDIAYINVSVIVLCAGLYNLGVSAIWRKVSSFEMYLYNNSFSYAFDLVFMVFTILSLNMSLPFGNFLLSIVAIALVIFVMNAIIGFFVKSMNRGYMNINIRNVSARLFFLAIISLILYYVGILLA